MSDHGSQIPLVWQSLDVRQTLKRAIAAALRACPLSREQVVDKIREQRDQAGINGAVTLPILEKWAAPSAKHIPPVYMIPIICKVTGSDLPIRAIAEPLGLMIAGPKEQAAMRAGFALGEKKKATRRFNRAMQDLEDAL